MPRVCTSRLHEARTEEESTSVFPRSRFYYPLAATIGLFGVYFLVLEQPIILKGRGDLREILFGSDLKYLLFIAFASAIVLGIRIFDKLFFDVLFSRKTSMVAPLLLRELLSITIYVVGFAWLISWLFGTSVTKLLTATTVVAAVIGLALQDTLGNLFSGISLHMERAYDVGDVIRTGEFIGVVEVANWRSTRIRAFNNQVVVLPNSVIARERLEVYPHRNLNARTVQVGVAYGIAPARVLPVLVGAAANVEGVSKEIPCLARIANLGDNGVIYEVKYWTRVYHQRDQIDADIRRVIWYALHRNEMSIPYPTRTVHMVPPSERVDAGDVPGDLIERLRAVDVLSPLTDSELASLAEGTEIHVFGRAETILRFASPGDSMFVVYAGAVSVRIPDGQGAFSEITQIGPGSVFGEMALLTGEARSADIVALTDTTVLEIHKKTLQPIILANPDLATAITSKIVARQELQASKNAAAVEETSVLSRIRLYFGLR